jgi:hypothetical protein
LKFERVHLFTHRAGVRRGDGMNLNFSVDQAMLTPAAVEGFVPVIIQIAPANLPMLLGMAEDNVPRESSAAGAISRL